jgi:hypothetical protein
LVAVVWIALKAGTGGEPAATGTAPPPEPTWTPAPIAAPTSTPTTAYKLAVIQSGYSVLADDPLVEQFRAALAQLATQCQEPRDMLSNYAVVTHDEMTARGVDESYLSILQHVSASIPASMRLKMTCAEVFAAYATLRMDGGN